MAATGASSGSPLGRPWLRVGLYLLPVLVMLAVNVPVLAALGTHSEEVAPLLRWVPDRVYSAPTAATPYEGAVLHESEWMPVWHVRAGENIFPLMTDGHIGAVTAWPGYIACKHFGVVGARAFGLLTGAISLIALVWAGERLGSRAAGAFAASSFALSPAFTLTHAYFHPEEEWTYLGFLLALFAYAQSLRTRPVLWLCAAAFMAGLAVASKTTALWTFFDRVVFPKGRRAPGVEQTPLPVVTRRPETTAGQPACACMSVAAEQVEQLGEFTAADLGSPG